MLFQEEYHSMTPVEMWEKYRDWKRNRNHMKHEHPVNKPFTVNRGQKTETRCVAVLRGEQGCPQCFFNRKYWDYSCGYGFLRSRCLAGGVEHARCDAGHRSDNTDIVYKKIKS